MFDRQTMFELARSEGLGNLKPKLELYNPSNPAAGAEVSVAVSAGEMWQLLSIRWRLTTDATVATRRPAVRIDDGTQHLFHMYNTVTLSESNTHEYYYGQLDRTDAPGGTYNPQYLFQGPPQLLLLPGWRVRSNTTSIQSGDQYSEILLYIVRWS